MKHNIDNCFIDSFIKKDSYRSSLKKTNFIIDEIKKSKDTEKKILPNFFLLLEDLQEQVFFPTLTL